MNKNDLPVRASLIRTYESEKQTLGFMQLWKGPILLHSCYTLERPWLNNERRVSSVPALRYECEVLQESPSFKYPHIWIKDVPGRDWIKVHIGNYTRQILGCVLVGTGIGRLADTPKGELSVISSTIALNEIMEILKEHNQESFTLEIIPLH